MKKLLMLLLAPLALATAACVPALSAAGDVTGVTKAISVCAGDTRDEKALYVLEASYNAPAQAYVSALQKGLLSEERKAQIKPKLITLYELLKTGRAAYDICDLTSLEAKADNAKAIAATVQALLDK